MAAIISTPYENSVLEMNVHPNSQLIIFLLLSVSGCIFSVSPFSALKIQIINFYFMGNRPLVETIWPPQFREPEWGRLVFKVLFCIWPLERIRRRYVWSWNRIHQFLNMEKCVLWLIAISSSNCYAGKYCYQWSLFLRGVSLGQEGPRPKEKCRVRKR